VAELAARGDALAEARSEKQELQEALARKLGEQQAAARAAAEELEELRRVVFEGEADDRRAARERQDMEHRIRQRLELVRAFAEDEQARAERAALAKQEETAFRAAMLEKMAREDRLEQLSAQRRRMKAAEHARSVETLIDERRARVALEREAELKGTETEQAAQRERARIIEEERQRLLAEHAERLLGFLPKGAIASRADAEKLGPQVAAYYQPQRRASQFDDDEDDDVFSAPPASARGGTAARRPGW
jgi:hypothetical protein